VEDYLKKRFGRIGLLDNEFTSRPPPERWSKTSPQHIDWVSFQRLLPAAFIDPSFVVVRHPVARILSAYHFQVEVERSTPPQTGFSDWLDQQARAFEEDPFIIDNHFRPQADFAPETCAVFHLEHGLDAIVPWLDGLTGTRNGPRFIGHANQRGSSKKTAKAPSAVPSSADMALIERIYAADFARFSYAPERKLPDTPRPALDAGHQQAARAGRERESRPLNRLAARVRRQLQS
jgi:hypothetical protein